MSSKLKSIVAIALVAATAVAWWGLDSGPESRARESVLDRQVVPADGPPEGFVVWSSNRSGNHDIYKMTLPDREITRLTDHPNVEYHPRISPDGTRVVFARSREPGLSTRNQLDWDVIMLDLETGKETFIHEYGNFPTWSANGRWIFFQFKVSELGAYDLEKDKASVVFRSGRGQVRQGAGFQTPHVKPDGGYMAVTLRFKQHLIGLVNLQDGTIKRIADGCQLTWSPDGDYLYFVDYGGRMKNAVYVYEPSKDEVRKWFDMPGEFSHEYFPKLSDDERWLVFGASRSEKEHEHDRADYENFLWQVGTPIETAIRLTHDEGNDNYPDIHVY